MFKKIDWYIIKRFLGSFGFTMMLLVSIAIAIDLSEKIDNFIEYHLTVKEVVLGFYLPFVPYIVALLGSYFIFITVIFFTSQMAAKSEIIAIFNSGVGYYRLMVPYIFAASILASFLWFSNNYLVPWSNKKRLAFENKYISHQMVVSNRNIHRKINDSTFVYFELYDNTEKQALKFSVERFKENNLTYKIVSEKATFDTAKKEWTLFNFIERKYYKHNETLNKGATTKILLDLNPQQFVKRWTYVEELTTPELQEKIDDLKEQGAEYVTAYQLELYRRSSTAFGVIILSVIGMTIASVKMRGGLGLHLVIGIAICSIFEVIQKFSVTFALNANLPAVIAVWMPNFVALVIGGFLVMRYQK